MHGSDERRVSAAAGTSVLRAAGVSQEAIDALDRMGQPISVSHAMSVVTARRSLAAAGLATDDVDALVPALAESDLAHPEAHAEIVARLALRLASLGVDRDAIRTLAAQVARRGAADVESAARDAEAAVRSGLDSGLAGAAAGSAAVRALSRIATESRRPAAEASDRDAATRRVVDPHDERMRKRKGGSTMGDSERRNGPGSAAGSEKERARERERLEREREALDREREKMDRERERADREREKLDREREKLDRLQEALEERLERQEERLAELEEELEERMDALEEAADELDDIEVDGIEGVREVLDVVSERLPHLMRGVYDSVYSPDKLRTTAESFATFYKTLTDSGIPAGVAAQLTQEHFARLDHQVRSELDARTSRRGGRGSPDPDPLGPNFDPLGPNFDPLGDCGHRPGKPDRPAEPAGPADPRAA